MVNTGKLYSGKGAQATILIKYIKPPQLFPNQLHQSNITLLDHDCVILLESSKFPIPHGKNRKQKKYYTKISCKGVVPIESKYNDNTSTMELKKMYSVHSEYFKYDSSSKFSSRLSSLQKTIQISD